MSGKEAEEQRAAVQARTTPFRKSQQALPNWGETGVEMSSMWPGPLQRRANRPPPHSTGQPRWEGCGREPAMAPRSLSLSETQPTEESSIEVHRLESDEGKLSCPVLRGGGSCEAASLPYR